MLDRKESGGWGQERSASQDSNSGRPKHNGTGCQCKVTKESQKSHLFMNLTTLVA